MAPPRRVHVLNGPNLDLLGIREPGHYGSGTPEDLRAVCAEAAAGAGLEVHLSNVYAREPFRPLSHVAAVCVGVVAGLGPTGYRKAIETLVLAMPETTTRRSGGVADTRPPATGRLHG